MDNTWVLQNVIHLVGSVDRLLEMLPSDLIDKAHKVASFRFITGNVLAHVLSYVYMSDVRSVLRVCKDWYNVRKNKVFWNRKILTALMDYSRRNPNINRNALLSYDSFMSPKEGQTLREQVEWLFKRHMFEVRSPCSISILCVDIMTYNANVISQFINIDGAIDSIHWKEKRYEGMFIHLAISSIRPTRKLIQNDMNSNNGTGLWIQDGNTFDGELLDVGNRTWLPHGSGKWTLSDGSIVEGECVAYKGEVRYKKIKN